MSIFYMRKTGKNYVKKHVKNGESHNFQKVLKSSIRLQMTFWIAEKIAIEYLTWNPKKIWIFIKQFLKNHKYRCQGALLTWFQKSEKMDFTWYLFKERSYDLINVWKKKTYDPSGFSPEIFFYWNKNWQKYSKLESCHFFFDHTVDGKDWSKKKKFSKILHLKKRELFSGW